MTSWKNWERKNTRPERPRTDNRFALTTPEKARLPNSRTSINGLGSNDALYGEEGEVSDPLPQALTLTAIVISFAVTVLLLVLAVTGRADDAVAAPAWRIASKALRPLPVLHKELSEESRVRQRYADLVVRQEARDMVRTKAAALRAVRSTLDGEGFIEVETPVLQLVHGGAAARPFGTHMNAFSQDMSLRIALELNLKKAVVGGVDKVYEMGRIFRNEGVDFSHNPEFTILEAYAAHSDYEQMRMSCQELIQRAAVAANGDCVVMRPEGPVRISGDWPVKTVHGAVSDALGAPIDPDTPVSRLRELCDQAEVAFRSDWDAGQIVLELYEHLVEARTELPTFYKDFPTSVSPLTRAHRSERGVAERWDLVAWGVELAPPTPS